MNPSRATGPVRRFAFAVFDRFLSSSAHFQYRRTLSSSLHWSQQIRGVSTMDKFVKKLPLAGSSSSRSHATRGSLVGEEVPAEIGNCPTHVEIG